LTFDFGYVQWYYKQLKINNIGRYRKIISKIGRLSEDYLQMKSEMLEIPDKIGVKQ